MANDCSKHADDAHDYSTQAKKSAKEHSHDLGEMQRVAKKAAQTLKQGQEKQRKREARKAA